MFDLALFDLDGTLTDPGEGITNSVSYALSRFGIDVPDRRTLYPFIGPPLVDSFMKYYDFSKDDALSALSYYREYFGDRGMFENEPYPGVPEMLKTLKKSGCRLVIATSKPDVFTMKILEHFALRDYFDFFACATMDEKRNRKDDVIEYALQNCGKYERAVMVGDREYDVKGAKKFGLSAIGVTYGYGSKEELLSSGADFLAETPADVARIILGRTRKSLDN